MTHHRFTEKSQRHRLQWIFSIILIGSLLWLGAGIQHTGHAFAQNADGAYKYQAVTATLTPDPLTDDVSPEVIREGRPTGILVGAIIILVIVLLSTFRSLMKQDHEFPANGKSS